VGAGTERKDEDKQERESQKITTERTEGPQRTQRREEKESQKINAEGRKEAQSSQRREEEPKSTVRSECATGKRTQEPV